MVIPCKPSMQILIMANIIKSDDITIQVTACVFKGLVKVIKNTSAEGAHIDFGTSP